VPSYGSFPEGSARHPTPSARGMTPGMTKVTVCVGHRTEGKSSVTRETPAQIPFAGSDTDG
jgi:hypothetical protein